MRSQGEVGHEVFVDMVGGEGASSDPGLAGSWPVGECEREGIASLDSPGGQQLHQDRGACEGVHVKSTSDWP